MDNETRNNVEEQTVKKPKLGVIISIILLVAIVGALLVFKNNIIYQVAKYEFENKDYYKAIELYETIDDFKDSKSMITESYYQIALDKIKTDRLDAIKAFEDLGDYKDSKEKIVKIKKSILSDSKKEIKKKNFDNAQEYLDSIKGFTGVKKAQKELYYQKAIYLNDNNQYTEAKEFFNKTKGYKKTDEYLNKTIYGLIGNSYNYTQVSYAYGISWDFSFSNTLSMHTIEVPSQAINTYGYNYYIKGDTIYCAEEDSDYYKEFLTLHNIKKSGNKIVSFSNGNNIVWKIQ